MKLCVLDCSFAMSWVFADEANSLADSLLNRLRERDSVVVPAVLWGLEVSNVLQAACRKKRMTRIQAEEKRQFMAELPVIEVIPPHGLAEAIFDLSTNHHLTSYDAAYLALAIEERLSLATKDDDLRKAARDSEVAIWGEGAAR